MKYSHDRLRSAFDNGAMMQVQCRDTSCRWYSHLITGTPEELLKGEVGVEFRVVEQEAEGIDRSCMDDIRDLFISALADDGSPSALFFVCPGCSKETKLTKTTVGQQSDSSSQVFVFARGYSPFPKPVRTSISYKLPDFHCETCESTSEAKDAITTGPDAPELGWTFYECPTCGSKSPYHASDQTV